MKIRNLTFLLIGLFVCSLARAQEPISFRNLSLGGVVSDKLDLIYDPVQLRYVDSLMLYTNLSNLTSSDEQIFANRSDNEYLIGISDKDPYLKDHWISALVRIRNNKTPSMLSLSSALNGMNDVWGSGTVNTSYSSYFDVTGDGLYDRARQISQQASGYQLSDGSSFILNNTFLVDAFTVGVKVGLVSSNWEANDAQNSLGTGKGSLSGAYLGMHSFSRSTTESDLKTDQLLSSLNESGNFLTQNDMTRKRIDASIMRPMGGFEVRADLCAYTIDEKMTIAGAYAGAYTNPLPATPKAVDSYQEMQSARSEDIRDGSAYGFGAGLRYIFKPSADRANQGFVEVSAGVIGELYDYTSARTDDFRSSENRNLVSSSNFSNNINWNRQQNHAGPGTTTIYYFNGRMNFPLRDGIYAGLGAFVSSSSQDIEAKYVSNYSSTQAYTTIDAVTNYLDYTQVVTDSEAGDENITHSMTDIRLPVGLEYRFTESKAWALRFGAVFDYTMNDDETRYQVTSSQPEVTKRTDGSGNTTVNTAANSYLSDGYHAVTKGSRTYYTHGLGYNPTDNLQIDLLGFFSANGSVTLLDYLKSLRLSFVLQI